MPGLEISKVGNMKTKLIGQFNQRYIECLMDGEFLDHENKALDLVAACGEGGTQTLMIHAGSLTEDFFQLRTGLAGSILQKFSNYHIRVAIILKPEQVNQGRFREMVLEANRGNQFRFFYEREPAEMWLLGVGNPDNTLA
jgi:PadR family transcriptional regulator, regulatory protein AphA